MEKVTIYIMSEFMGDVIGTQAKLSEVKIAPYAQYREAIHTTYIPKGKRKARRMVKSGCTPFVLIVKGHHPTEMVSGSVVSEENSEYKVTQSKYCCFDDRYRTDFNEVMDKYIEKNGIEVVFDSRTEAAWEREKKISEVSA